MNHIVTLDAGANEIGDLISGIKSMIIQGADLKCVPYGIVEEGDILYFVNNDKQDEVKAKGVVSTVYNSYPLSVEESYEMIIRHQHKLNLPDDLFYKWAGKKYIVLLGLKDVEEVKPFFIKGSILSNTGDWCCAVNLNPIILRDRKTA